MKKHLTYWTIILLLSFSVPVCIQFLFRIFRLENIGNLNHIGLFEFVFTAFVLPFYLVIIHHLINKKFQVRGYFAIYAFIIFTCILISSSIDYINWADTVKNNVDAESRDFIEVGLLLQFITGLFVGELSLFFNYLFIKKNAKPV